jgi:hypothetical protein
MRAAVPTVLLVLLCTSPALAWGFNAHRFIAGQAIALLPPELKPIFESRRAVFVERSIDPDLWRTVGWDAEPPNHFVDLDYYGRYPFTELPRDYDRAVQRFGRDVVHQQGLLPWRAAEFYGRLQRAFESAKNPSGPYSADDIILFAAVLSHYVGDGHVPLHAVLNYDGQLTGQWGIHRRWESDLFDRTRTRIAVRPPAVAPVSDPRDYMFGALLASNRLADGVLAADRAAVAGREFYDDTYFERLAASQFDVMQRRLNDAIAAVASMIAGAWQQAGRPAVSPDGGPRGPRPVRRPPA